jgi:hypothetical protein
MSALTSATGDGRAGAGRPSQAAVAADRDSEALLDPVGGRIRVLRRICIGMSLLAVISGTLMLVMTNRYIEGLLPRMLNVISVLASGIVCATAIRAFGPGGIIPAARRSDDEPHGTRSGEPPARNQASSESSSLPRGYRRYGRIVPRHDRTRVTLQDGTFHDATIVDFSRSGAALSVRCISRWVNA